MQSTTQFTIQTSSMDTDICEFTNLLTDIHVHLSTHKMNKIKIQQKNKNKKNKKIEINHTTKINSLDFCFSTTKHTYKTQSPQIFNSIRKPNKNQIDKSKYSLSEIQIKTKETNPPFALN